QAGQPLHQNGVQCIFCGQELTDSRKHDIERHFSDEVAKVQRELDDLLTATEEVTAAVDAVIRRVPDRGLLFEDLREGFDEGAQAILEQSEPLLNWARQLAARLQLKRSNVLERVDSTVSPSPVVDGSSLERVRAAHNARVAQHSTLIASAAREIEVHHLKAEEASFDEWSAKEQASKETQHAADERIAEIDSELASLGNDAGDPTPSADVLTREVARLLGRDELSFSAVEGRYVVTRDGDPAVNLSVGERSAITLVHFLEKVARHDASNGRPIVVIDDPVSSLDSNVFMGISTYIWAAAMRRDMCQLVLLTHNFDLFKQWDVQLESLHRDKRMAADYPANLYELRSRHVMRGGLARRRAAVVKWPESELVRKKVRSSYHHAFVLVVDASRRLAEDDSLENRLDAQLLFPNVIRRILESFLAFKRPEWAGDFTTSMRDAGRLLVDSGYPGDADALRLQLTRFAHAYSHSQSPETDESLSPDEVGAVIRSVFVFMDQIDHNHFVGLCAVVGVAPDDLLRAPGRPIEGAPEVP
ncbi:MAG: AAA family ATPase, partial [Actinomycetes bacterium]